jgi:hypothetical protein
VDFNGHEGRLRTEQSSVKLGRVVALIIKGKSIGVRKVDQFHLRLLELVAVGAIQA